MTNGYMTVEEYIKAHEPYHVDEIEIQAADLEPWIENKEKHLDIAPAFNDAGQRVYQKGLIAWAWLSGGVTSIR